METIYQLVRNIVFLVLLAAFLEMLLPLKETRRFVEVIFGLFVVVAVLNPVVALFDQKRFLTQEVYQEVGAEELEAILSRGKELQRAAAVEARAVYGKRLEDQIRTMACLVPGVGAAVVKVEQEAWDPSLQSVGGVERVFITLRPEEDDNQSIPPVERVYVSSEADEPDPGNRNPEGRQGREEARLRVQETIASFFGLRKEQVIVIWENER
ncbi:stage III sporulation protein AF [Thermacetogenium phaeum DSM 12270]|uniref:Stage III sporulation protein AF n=1 Tax=Thermacetogenium phaeum (strain ATCC BAA-254 / DSM 26808 / PB) TaxID=1089553 RepID=K4LFS0_THEPS|nr:stage III sporulation protein AF [Thermacetogenium phaeum]AFV11846.1 stage III sporulation protein AF [Thermacetogenium phaeum DSM 12270]